MPTNVEIKAHCPHPEKIKQILESKHAVFKGIDHQIDTYFNVPNGRLKLREGTIENHLIHYHRKDDKGPKKSIVTLFQTQPDSSLKKILIDSMGIKTIIDKKRSIYFINNVKFHLDSVEHLGFFVEIEAIDRDGSISINELTAQCEYYMQLFEIAPAHLLQQSYSDMILSQ